VEAFVESTYRAFREGVSDLIAALAMRSLQAWINELAVQAKERELGRSVTTSEALLVEGDNFTRSFGPKHIWAILRGGDSSHIDEILNHVQKVADHTTDPDALMRPNR
jgi:hypothetical protein